MVRKYDNTMMIPAILYRDLLKSQQPLFKVAMIANSPIAYAMPIVFIGPGLELINPLKKIWCVLDGNVGCPWNSHHII
jgi:hypothetical protein